MTPFFMAWMMFVWIPCPVQKWDETKRKEMLLCYPFIGIMIGAIWYALFFLSSLTKPSPILNALIAFFPWLITGFMHMDGFLDCTDAVLSFKSTEKKLEILKDSHVGSFAVIAMVILGVFQYAAISQIMQNGLSIKEAAVLVLIPALSRAVTVNRIFAWTPLPTSSYIHIHEGQKTAHTIIPIVMIAVFSALILLICGLKVFEAVLIGIAIELLIHAYLKNNLGGMSGDISGASLTVGELAFLIALAFI